MVLSMYKSTLSGDSCDVSYIDENEVRSTFYIDLVDKLQKTRKKRFTEFAHKKPTQASSPSQHTQLCSLQILHDKFFSKAPFWKVINAQYDAQVVFFLIIVLSILLSFSILIISLCILLSYFAYNILIFIYCLNFSKRNEKRPERSICEPKRKRKFTGKLLVLVNTLY